MSFLKEYWRQIKRKVRAKRKFWSQYDQFCIGSKEGVGERFTVRKEDILPCLGDDTANTGFDPHYVYHTAWAARRIVEKRPVQHVDISSFLYFSSLLSATVPVKFYDYRPAQMVLSGLETSKADLCKLHFPTNSINSLSCMHTIEHVGLGRYGDPIDPAGDLKAIEELKRVLAPGGSLYFVVPVGKPRVCFNAHRVYSYQQIEKSMHPLKLTEFSLIPDVLQDGVGIIEHASPDLVQEQNYGCGLFIYTK